MGWPDWKSVAKLSDGIPTDLMTLVGTPPQYIDVIFDSGSPFLNVVSEYKIDCGLCP